MDPEDVEYKIQEETKAIVYVHFGGNSTHLTRFEEICDENGLDLVCDAAQALGGTLSRRARFSCVSLQAIKSLTAGDGGILICRDPEDAEKARKLRWFGYDRALKQKLGDCDLDLAGYKMHMNDINAAIARGNLSVWKTIKEHRENINRVYVQYGMGKGFISGIWNPQVVGMSYAEAYTRAALLGVEIGQYHYRNDKYSIFKGVYSNCPNMDAIDDKYFMLPCHMGMTIDDAHKIAKAIWA
jgi:dTDP-4-amino-4,6-dideoxygalactose transaminase